MTSPIVNDCYSLYKLLHEKKMLKTTKTTCACLIFVNKQVFRRDLIDIPTLSCLNVFMKVSLNILLESFRHYRLESRIDESREIAFRQARLIPANGKGFDSDFLYVGTLSKVLALKDKGQGTIFLCICDKEMNEQEQEQFLSSVVLIREKITTEQLLAEVQQNILVIQEWLADMQNAVIYQKGLQGILDLSEPVLGNFISINDSALALLAYTKNITTDDEVSLFLVNNGYHSPETVKMFKRRKRFEMWFNADNTIVSTDRYFSKYIVVSRVFVHNETNFTNVVMSCNHKELSPGVLDLFDHLVRFLGYYIERDLKERRNTIYSSLIADLMNGKISDQGIATERAKSVGILPDAETAILLLAESNDEHVVFSDRIARDISHQFQYIKPINFNQRLLLLLNHPNIRFYMGKQGIGDRLNTFLKENNIFCGVSDSVNSLLDLPDAYLQAEFSLKNREHLSYFDRTRMEQREWSNLIQFSEHYAGFLLNHEKNADRIWQSSKYGKMLRRLYENDIEKNTNNLAVLYSFLINERRATETAAALYMHRNNVLYRIGRIEELLNIRLDDSTTRINLLITFMLFNQVGFSNTVVKTTAEQTTSDPEKTETKPA